MDINECQELIELANCGDSEIITNVMRKIAPPNVIYHVDDLSMITQVVDNNPHEDKELCVMVTPDYIYASDGYRVALTNTYGGKSPGMYTTEGTKLKDLPDELGNESINQLLKAEYTYVGNFSLKDVTISVEDDKYIFGKLQGYRFHHNHLIETLAYSKDVDVSRNDSVFRFIKGDVQIYLTEMTGQINNG